MEKDFLEKINLETKEISKGVGDLILWNFRGWKHGFYFKPIKRISRVVNNLLLYIYKKRIFPLKIQRL
jgi:hypothetical protein